MAKIVLKTNLANNTVSIPQTHVSAVVGSVPNAVEISITPINGYKILAKDFSTGALHAAISDVVFLGNSNGNVTMRVSFNHFTYTGNLLVIDLPVNAKSSMLVNSFKLVERMSVDNNVMVSDGITRAKTSYAGGGTHNVIGTLGKTIDVITKTLSVPDNYYFATEPSYVISGKNSRYKVSTSEQVDRKGRLISKTFNIKYTFPNTELNTALIDTITFTAKSKKTKVLLQDKKVTTAKEGKIYSIDTGQTIGVNGGVKKIVIKGIPGTRFNVNIATSSGELYNQATGSFTQGQPLSGVIPEARAGVGYGEYKRSILIPASSGASAVNIKLSTKADIDHVKLADYLLDSSKPTEGPVTVDQVININPTLTIALRDGGPVDTSEDPSGHPGIFKIFRELVHGERLQAEPVKLLDNLHVANGVHVIGAGVSGSGISSFLSANPIVNQHGRKEKGRSFIIAADGDANNLRINRTPKFAKKGYASWNFATQLGFESSDSKVKTAGGEKILSDFGSSVKHTVTSDTSDGVDIDFSENGWDIKNIEVSLEGIDIVGETDLSEATPTIGTGDNNIYRYVKVTVGDIDGVFGKEDLTIELNLKNFLSTIQV